MTQSVATPEPPFWWSSLQIEQELAKAFDVSPHPEADGLVQDELPPYFLILTVFTSLACFLGTFQDRGLSSPYHVATTYPCAQPSLPSLRPTGGTHNADKTVPRQGVHSRFLPSPACATPHKVLAHTQVRDPRGSAAACSGWPSVWRFLF